MYHVQKRVKLFGKLKKLKSYNRSELFMDSDTIQYDGLCSDQV